MIEDSVNPSNWLSLESWQKNKKTELHLIEFIFFSAQSLCKLYFLWVFVVQILR